MQISKKRELPRKYELKYCEGWHCCQTQVLAGAECVAGGRGGWNATYRFKQRKPCAGVRVCARVCVCVCVCWGEDGSGGAQDCQQLESPGEAGNAHGPSARQGEGLPSCPPCRYPVLLHQQPEGPALGKAQTLQSPSSASNLRPSPPQRAPSTALALCRSASSQSRGSGAENATWR